MVHHKLFAFINVKMYIAITKFAYLFGMNFTLPVKIIKFFARYGFHNARKYDEAFRWAKAQIPTLQWHVTRYDLLEESTGSFYDTKSYVNTLSSRPQNNSRFHPKSSNPWHTPRFQILGETFSRSRWSTQGPMTWACKPYHIPTSITILCFSKRWFETGRRFKFQQCWKRLVLGFPILESLTK